MDSIKFGAMIAAMRKENEMTQKELAEKLHVTDKAVSKWERGKGYPEITLLPMIAEVLGVTASELLSGERNAEGVMPPAEEEALVNDMIQFADKVSKFKASGIMFSMISILFVIAGFVCLLCNYIISRMFDWSLYPLGALLMVWFTLAPWFLFKKHRALFSLAALTASLIPYLFLIELICPAKGWVVLLALPILGITIAALLVVVLLFAYTRINHISLWAFTAFIFGVLVNLAVNTIVQNYLNQQNQPNISVTITAVSFAFISIVLAVIGDIRRRKNY